MNFGLCRPCAIGTGERRNKTCQLLINLVSSCVLKLDNASVWGPRPSNNCCIVFTRDKGNLIFEKFRVITKNVSKFGQRGTILVTKTRNDLHVQVQ